MNKSFKWLLAVLILLVMLAGFFNYRVKIKNLWQNLTKEKIPIAVEFQEADRQNQKNQESNTLSQASTSNIPNNLTNELPTSFNLDVPFTSQAPTANWDETFKEACEEASALMVDYYYKNKTLAPAVATAEILKMVDWQIKNFNGHFDLTVQQTAEMIKNYFGYQKVEVLDNPTIDDIKFHLNKKRPVIVPAAGRELANPYFRTPGPLYHMLVIKGYTENQFITNDPGTKRGENYLYDYEIIMNAMHDWNNSGEITEGAKRIIVIYPN